MPLRGIRVVDLSSGPVGGAATVVLADFGADVIKLEPPAGDRFRTQAAAPLWLRGKRSAVLDLTLRDGRASLRRLARGADVVVVSGPPGRAAQLGADFESLSAENPGLVHCAISGWGPRGPYADYPGYEGLVAAKSGRMGAFTGQRARAGPAFAAVRVASHAASQGAVHGILAALLARERTGRGQRVETSLLQGMLPFDLAALLLVQLAERDQNAPDPTAMGGGMPTLNYHPVMASDGRWIQLGNLLEHLFYAFLDAIDLLPELLADERFAGPPATWSGDVLEEARDRILMRVRERPAAAWMERFRSNGNVAAEPYLTTQEALDQPDLVANGDVVRQQHPELGELRMIGPIAQLTRTPGRADVPAPALGADTEAVLAEPERERTDRSPGGASPRGRPLDGITVLECATIIAAPLGTSLLADLGARVIKIEALGGDPYRHLLPGGLLAVKTNAGKESLCLDLKSTEARPIVRELLARADVVVHNFRPGVPERLGIDYASACAARADVVWVSANGYGPDSPGARRPSAHPVPGAAMGGAGYQAGADMPPDECAGLPEIREAARQLMRANEPNPDPNTSVVIASAALLGLLARARQGIGQAIYVNMLTANAWANADDFLSYAGKPERPPVDAQVLGSGAGYRLYPARDGWVFLAVTTDAEWARLARAVGRPELASHPRFANADPRFANADARRAHDTALAHALEALFTQRSADDWEKLLANHGVGCVRAETAPPGRFFCSDEQMLRNGFAPAANHARFGPLRRWGPLVTCDGGADHYGPGALAGDATDRILAELGHGPDEIQRLREAGVVGSEPVAALGVRPTAEAESGEG